MALNTTQFKKDLAKPLPLYSKTMRKYVVQTSIELLRVDIRRAEKTLLEKKVELEKQLDGVAHWGDVTLRPSDVFTHDKRYSDCIDEPEEWESLLAYFQDHGVTDIEELVHTLRCRHNVIQYCKENALPLPEGYSD